MKHIEDFSHSFSQKTSNDFTNFVTMTLIAKAHRLNSLSNVRSLSSIYDIDSFFYSRSTCPLSSVLALEWRLGCFGTPSRDLDCPPFSLFCVVFSVCSLYVKGIEKYSRKIKESKKKGEFDEMS